jgi:hypothetical protein
MRRSLWRFGHPVLGVVLLVLLAFGTGTLTGNVLAAPEHGPSDTHAPGALVQPGRRVLVFGDSLVTQSEPYLTVVARALDMRARARASGGIAPCDALEPLAHEVRTSRPSIVVLAFSGNSLSDCMRGGDGQLLQGAAVVAKYRSDTEAAIRIATHAGIPMVLASPPTSQQSGAAWEALDAAYRDLAAANQPQVQYTDAGVQIAPDGHFVAEQRCLPFELSFAATRAMCAGDAGSIRVRSPDGVHFCSDPSSAKSAATSCSTYSSGALRYAIALVTAARLQLDYLSSFTR